MRDVIKYRCLSKREASFLTKSVSIGLLWRHTCKVFNIFLIVRGDQAVCVSVVFLP